MIDDTAVSLTDLVDGTLAGPEWDDWLANHPTAAAEVAIARQVRELMIVLQQAELVVPAGFETRLLAAVRADAVLLSLLDLGTTGLLRALLELLQILFDPFREATGALA